MKQKYLIKIFVCICIALCIYVENTFAQNTRETAIDLGVKTASFTFTNTQDTRNLTDNYRGSGWNDVFYRFTVTENTLLIVSHCASEVNTTAIYLLDSSGYQIEESNSYDEVGGCNQENQASMKYGIYPGTYYIVSEGLNANGNITTYIEGNFSEKFALSNNQNYIVKIVPLIETRQYYSSDPFNAGVPALTTIQYFDGLGRPTESVQKGITPNRADLVALQEYDDFGRESNAWLPGVFAGNNGAFVADPKLQIVQTYGNDDNPHLWTDYEASPLNRVTQQFGPGQNWHNNGKAVKTEYLTNKTTTELRCLNYSVSGSGMTTTLKANSYYAANQLFVTKIADEDGNLSYEFKDKLGRVLLTRQKNGMDYYDTYYVYDDFGNLCYVLSPMTNLTTTPSNDENDALKKYAYIYKYDERNRCIWKKLPGCEPIYMVYDKADRLIFSQDGEQRKTNTWAYSKYDAFGRIIISGTQVINKSHDQLRNEYREAVVTEQSGTGAYQYTWNTMPDVNYQGVLIANYYDNYDFLTRGDFSGLGLQYKLQSGFNTRYGDDNNKTAAKGLLTGRTTAVLDADGYYYSIHKAFYYDYRGNLIQTQTDDIDYTNQEYFAYNFSGQVTEKKTKLNHLMSAYEIHERYRYAYDHAGRLQTVKHQINDQNYDRPEVTLVENTYDELGRLKTAMPANRQDLKLTYDYNIRSWLTKISGQKFSEKLYYNESFTGNTPRWNGNISSMEKKDGTLAEWGLGYNYTYDNLSRLTDTQSFFTESGGSIWFGDDYSCSGGYGTHYGYDKNGNMNYLFRLEDLELEDISISYNGNQMNRITNWVAEIPDEHPCHGDNFIDYSQGTGAYTYDANGSMTKDPYKGAEYVYNVLGMPKQVKVPAIMGTIDYAYSATGEKLGTAYTWHSGLSLDPVENVNRPKYTSPNSSKRRFYVGNKVLDSNSLPKILFDNGYYWNGIYYFYLRDHLGNNCVVARDNGQVVQNTYYFPYGKVNNNESGGQSAQPYKFGGKEEELMFGLGLYDLHARQYNSDLGSFTTGDSKAEEYYSWSQYAYCLGNPVRYVDRDGKQVVVPIPGMFPATGTSNAQDIPSLPSFQEVKSAGQNLIDAAVRNFTMSALFITMPLWSGTESTTNSFKDNPGKKEQDKREREAKTGLDKNQAEVAKGINNNIGSPSPDGNPDPKGGKPKGGAFVKILGGAAAIGGIIEQFTNPDPTKDAHDAHMKEANKENNQLPQDTPKESNTIEKIMDWILK